MYLENSLAISSMGTLSRNGLIVEGSKEIKKELTVRPVENALGLQSPSFKVWRGITGRDASLLVPRYFGLGKFGPPTRDARRDPAPAGNINFVGKLRRETNQEEAFDRGVAAFASTGGGVLSLPPGYGKTCMALAFSARLKVRTMIVVHKEFLANQWRDRIQTFCPGATIGRVQGDTFDTDKDFVIALIQTMCQREFAKDAFDSIGLLIVDEAHHIGAPAFSQFMFKICPRFTLGLTATPERKDGLTRLLYWFLGPEFFRVERADQKTTRVEVVHYTDEAFRDAPPVTRFGKINMAGMINIVTELPARNEILVGLIEKALSATPPRRVLVLTDRREHCFYLHERLGSKSGLYIGGMKEAELAISAEKPVVIATFQLAQEGLDIPALDTVILSTPKSDIKQSIGRIMRETPGKLNDPLIIDVVDHWSVLFSMFRKRSVIYNEGGFQIVSSGNEEKTEVYGKGRCLFS